MSATRARAETMRQVELRRHAMRVKPGEHLSREGVALARRVGEGMGPFDRVFSSPSPRALETAIAMGFAVDEFYAPLDLRKFDGEMDPEGCLENGFAGLAELFAQGGQVARFGGAQAEVWRGIGRALPEGGAALVISHGCVLEISAIACLPQADHRGWGGAFGYCEGMRLYLDGERFVRGELLRLRA